MNKKGQTIVEFGIIITLLCFILMSIFQISILFNAWHITKYAAYCAARAKAIGFDDKSAKLAAYLAMVPVSARFQGLENMQENNPDILYDVNEQDNADILEDVSSMLGRNYNLRYSRALRNYDFSKDIRGRFISACNLTEVNLITIDKNGVPISKDKNNKGFIKVTVKYKTQIFDPFLRIANSFVRTGSSEDSKIKSGDFQLTADYIMKDYSK